MTAPGPLDGIKVLDLTSVVLGPMTGQYLGDMGADVIKIEPPEGDITRSIGARRSPGMGALFLANNRNKRSVVLDLKRRGGQEALRTMALTSDVLLHSVRAASAARLGLSYESLAAENPRLVYCHVKGFSDVGAYAGRPAYDDIVQALSGLAMLQTIAAGEPRYVPSIIADKITAVHAAYAIMLALFSRERTGRGQSVGVPMLETMVAFNSAEHLGGCVFEPPEGKMGYEPVRQGMRRPFRTRDGWLCVLPYTDTNWRRFFELSGRPDLAADPRYGTQQGRQQNLELVLGELARQLATRASAEWTRGARRGRHSVRGRQRSRGPAARSAPGERRLLAAARASDRRPAAPAGQPDRAVGDAAVHPAPAAGARRAHRRGAGSVRLRRGRHRTPGVRQGSLMDYDKNFALVTTVPPRLSSWVARRKQS